ncbi:MAG: HlyD family efflux transporter periplasmic adaptor subunit [Marinobacter sp.]|uniref:efflux RND transporter periplasmic adaptor subunit n=1 Tax=Marinobacter sp. TaxID=50741 RepID=UPI00299DB5A5|nr:HlyD family efflux transporter periplasmic adaptor subunit [Marinobacter sp.]MDX1756590.1 HlyD family efflux transporter periplasmic adaptor subunit [Marinobacter sp.]
MKLGGRWAFWSVFAILVVLALAAALRPEPVWVELAQVTRGPLSVTIVEEGKTRVKDRYIVSSPVAGYLHRIELDVGDPVEPSQLLAELEPVPVSVLDARSRAEAAARVEAARASLASARQTVRAAQADAQFTRQDHQRLLQLSESGFVSSERLQQAQAVASRADALLRSARFNEEVAAHELAAARTRLEISGASPDGGPPMEQVLIRSPVRGSILGVLRENEGVVQAGTPILEVGDPGALEVVVEVLSYDAVKLRPALPVRLHGWGGPELEARVRRIEPVGFEDISALGVEEQRVRVIVDLHSPQEDWATLGDGYRIDAEFVLWQGDDQLQLPASALFTEAADHQVFVVEDGVARIRPVTAGPSNGLFTVIEQGLKPGQWVVRHPDRQLNDGDRVRER